MWPCMSLYFTAMETYNIVHTPPQLSWPWLELGNFIFQDIHKHLSKISTNICLLNRYILTYHHRTISSCPAPHAPPPLPPWPPPPWANRWPRSPCSTAQPDLQPIVILQLIPQKPYLQPIIQGKELICITSAVSTSVSTAARLSTPASSA